MPSVRLKVLFFVGLLIAYFVVSCVTSTHPIKLPAGLYTPVVGLFCSLETQQSLAIALALGGAVLPLAMGVLLAAIFLRGGSSILGLCLTTPVVCLFAYHFSEVVPSGGVVTRGPWLGPISGLLSIFTTGARSAL